MLGAVLVMNPISNEYAPNSIYLRWVKRLLDIICSSLTIIVFWWLLLIVAILVKIKLGSPVIFKQPRPGKIDPRTGQESMFVLYKFRSMTNETDENGKLLPNEARLTKFGKLLRSLSLDELPEVFNIFMGDMSVIGPRPQLVDDVVFMTDEQRLRHLVRPGLSGLSQISGRNALSWDVKLSTDLEYLKRISFVYDFKIVLKTIVKVFRRDGDASEIDICEDYGDFLLERGSVTPDEYKERHALADKILSEYLPAE